MPFETVVSSNIGKFPVYKWIHKESGFSMCLVKTHVTEISCNIVVATETHNQLGCPHTLEHLCFMGSKRYPFNSTLTQMAERVSAEINAYTAEDITAYEMTVPSEKGFLRLLPVFADHVLQPVLSDAAFRTEVFHVNEQGEESGVVFSEMQNVQNYELDWDTMREIMYPASSGYRYNTGGLTQFLRKLTVEDIRKYHKQYYTPSNVCVVVLGPVDENALLKVGEQIVSNFMEDGFQSSADWKRPWVDTYTPCSLPESVVRTVEKPADEDDENAEVKVWWYGPLCNDVTTVFALDLLFTYLSTSAVSPISQTFIEIEDPWCNNASMYVDEGLPSAINLSLSGVPLERMDELAIRIHELLRSINSIDMQRMEETLTKSRNELLTYLETDPSLVFMDTISHCHAFGPRDGSNLVESLDYLRQYDIVQSWTEKQWLDLLRKWIVDAKSVTIKSRPSFEFAQKLKQEQEERVQQAVEKYGPEGLSELGRQLELAKQANETRPPVDLIRNFAHFDHRDIKFYESKTAVTKSTHRNEYANDVQALVSNDETLVQKNPWYIQFDHIESAFVTTTAHISTCQISPHLKDYLGVFARYVQVAPACLPNGEQLDHEQLVRRLERETVSHDVNLDVTESTCRYTQQDSTRETLVAMVRVLSSDYERAVFWLGVLLAHTTWDVSRLQSVVGQLLSEVKSQFRNPEHVAPAFANTVLYNDHSLRYRLSLIQQRRVLEQLRAQLHTEPETLIRDLELLRKELLRPENIRLHVYGDVLQMKEPVKQWQGWLTSKSTGETTDAGENGDFLSSSVFETFSTGTLHVIPMPATESSDIIHAVRGPKDWTDPQLPVIMLLSSWVSIFDGAVGTAIRGAGLAYGYHLSIDVEGGIIYFVVNSSPDVVQAWSSLKELFGKISANSDSISNTELDTARCIAYSQLTYLGSNPRYAARTSFDQQALKGLGADAHRKLLDQLSQVGLDAVRDALRNVFTRIFDPAQSTTVVTSSLAKLDTTVSTFSQAGYAVEIQKLGECEDGDESEVEDQGAQ